MEYNLHKENWFGATRFHVSITHIDNKGKKYYPCAKLNLEEIQNLFDWITLKHYEVLDYGRGNCGDITDATNIVQSILIENEKDPIMDLKKWNYSIEYNCLEYKSEIAYSRQTSCANHMQDVLAILRHHFYTTLKNRLEEKTIRTIHVEKGMLRLDAPSGALLLKNGKREKVILPDGKIIQSASAGCGRDFSLSWEETQEQIDINDEKFDFLYWTIL